MLNIGEYVQRERDARGWTLEYLASMTGIRASHLSRLAKHPPKTPDVDTVKKIAQAFCVEPTEIWREISGLSVAPVVTSSHRLASQIEQYLSSVSADKRPVAERMLIDHARNIRELLAAP